MHPENQDDETQAVFVERASKAHDDAQRIAGFASEAVVKALDELAAAREA